MGGQLRKSVRVGAPKGSGVAIQSVGWGAEGKWGRGEASGSLWGHRVASQSVGVGEGVPKRGIGSAGNNGSAPFAREKTPPPPYGHRSRKSGEWEASFWLPPRPKAEKSGKWGSAGMASEGRCEGLPPMAVP